MVYCNHCVNYDVEHHQACCDALRKVVNEEQCIKCTNYLWRYKDLDIGQCYFDISAKHFGIKLTSCRAYNLDEKHVYGFAGNHENDSEDRRYLKANVKVEITEEEKPKFVKLESERPQGEWIKNNHTFWTCNKCNFVNDFNRIEYSFCPNCGAEMKGGAE